MTSLQVEKPLPVHHVLWTGGWDSTYRVLDLVLVQQRTVQPYYVLDPGRRSTRTEMAVIQKIRSAVSARESGAGRRLLSPRFIKRLEIRPNATVTAAFRTMKGERRLGSQYEWLARLAEQEDLTSLELAVHRDDRFAKFVDRPGFEAYGRFSLPLLSISKREMKEAAEKGGFIDILEMSWFCHQPVRGKTCGVCVPCTQAIEEGMGYRVTPLGTFDRVVVANVLMLRDRVVRRLRNTRSALLGQVVP